MEGAALLVGGQRLVEERLDEVTRRHRLGECGELRCPAFVALPLQVSERSRQQLRLGVEVVLHEAQ